MKSNIFIAKPCHENWNKMTPQEKGRFCGSCAKVVRDFSDMSNEQIIESLKESESEVCGRVNVHQLTPVNNRQKVYFWIKGTLWRNVVYSILAFIGFTFLFKKSSYAQTVKGQMPLRGKMSYDENEFTVRELTVVVYDNYGNPLEYSDVDIYCNNVLATSGRTDKDGSVRFNLQKFANKEVLIDVHADGFSRKKTTKVKLNKEKQTIKISLDEMYILMGDILFVPDPEQSEIAKNKELLHTVEIEKNDKPVTIPVSICETPLVPVEVSSPRITEISSERDSNTIEPITIAPSHEKFYVFPIPAWDFVTIESSDLNDPFSIIIYDNNGKQFLRFNEIVHRKTIEVASWPAGIYYALIMVQDKAIETKKIIVAK